MTPAMDAAASNHTGSSPPPLPRHYDDDSNSDYEEQYGGQHDILPGTMVGILRRMQEEFKCPICLGTMEQPMLTGCNHTFCRQCIHHALDRKDGCPLCKTHVTKRSLNSINHLERLINSFVQLKEAFEREDGYTLSQAPRSYAADPQENLSQLFPYPEKDGGPSAATHESHEQLRKQTPKRSSKQDSTSKSCSSPPQEPGHTQRSTLENNHISEGDMLDTGPYAETSSKRHPVPSSMDMDIDCFDVDLDTVPVREASQLAEKMLTMMSLASLAESLNQTSQLISSTPPLPPPTATVAASSRTPQQQSQSSQLMSAQPRSQRPWRSQQFEFSRVKHEDLDNNGLPTPSPRVPSSLHIVKTEPISTQETLPFDCCPTQDPFSKEINVILCGTFMSAQKKHQMESAAKALKATTIDDLVTQPTHVIMDISTLQFMNGEQQSRNGSGRTVKYFLGILRGCWVLRFEWITASVNAGYWVDEVAYQIHDNELETNAPKRSRASRLAGDSPLLSGYEIQLWGTFSNPTKEEVELMIRAGGGTVVAQLFLRDTRCAKSLAASALALGDPEISPPLRHLILYDQAGEGVLRSRKLNTHVRAMKDLARSLGKWIKVVQHKVLLDCIAAFDMTKLTEGDKNE